MQQFKLANVLLEVEDFLADNPEAFYRAEEGSTCAYDGDAKELSVSGLVDFTTYFNGVSVGKWRKYADIDRIMLHVELAGDACTLALRSLAAEGPDAPFSDSVESAIEVAASKEFAAFDVIVPSQAVIGGFALLTEGTVRLRNAFYYAEVPQQRIRPVMLALCTTTFRKEEFIVPNIERIKEGVLGCDDPVAKRFHMFVVDNGCTLDGEALSDDHVTVIPNPNVGGAGGFARGMMAAQDSDAAFTHVILMDDDVRMSVESFKRTFALLSLVTDDYAEACLNGAMLELEHPWLQYEDVAYVRKVGGYDRIKWDTRIDSPRDIVRNELIDVETGRTYGAWWYSCIPMTLIERHGLPVPFFVRCDDVEYGVRLNTRYMTLSGICVWHAGFNTRFNAAVSCYQYVRNMMAMMAMHDDFFRQDVFMVRFWRTFHYLLRTMDYNAAELWLDGMDAYMEGPEALMRVNGADLLRENSGKTEKLVPIEQLDPSIMAQLDYNPDWLVREEGHDNSALKKAMLTVPHDRHWFPDFMLNSQPGVLAPGFENYSPWWSTAMRTHLVALNSDATCGAVRELDRARFDQLMKRFGQIMSRYGEENQAVVEQWRDSLAVFSSREFWERYIEERR